MEDIRNFLALPVRTVQEGHSFTKTWKPGGPLALKRLSMYFVRGVLKTRNDANYRI